MSDGTYRPERDITNYESRYREMDPKTEDLIGDGYELKEGMRVLIADPALRNDTSRGFGRGDHEIDQKLLWQAKQNNRWCVVSKPMPDFDNDLISFIGVYDDGTKRKRMHQRITAWLVKLDSMPKTDELGNEKGCCISCCISC